MHFIYPQNIHIFSLIYSTKILIEIQQDFDEIMSTNKESVVHNIKESRGFETCAKETFFLPTNLQISSRSYVQDELSFKIM